MDGMKAKKTGFVMYGKYSDEVEYEYRGHKYMVEYPKCWTYCCTKPKIQHENKQWEIDRQIEQEERQKQKPYRYEDTADYGFELFWKYVTGEIEYVEGEIE